MNIGARIKTLRENRGMTVYRLANLAGMPQNHVTNIENGLVSPRIDTLEKIVRPLGCTMAEFFNEDTEAYYLSDREKQMLSEFRTLSEAQQKTMHEMISMIFHTRK